jgi:hypothetical protein
MGTAATPRYTYLRPSETFRAGSAVRRRKGATLRLPFVETYVNSLEKADDFKLFRIKAIPITECRLLGCYAVWFL